MNSRKSGTLLLGVCAGGIVGEYISLFVLFLIQNIDCQYSLEPPAINVLSKNIKKYIFFTMKFSIFTGEISVYCMDKSLLYKNYICTSLLNKVMYSFISFTA